MRRYVRLVQNIVVFLLNAVATKLMAFILMPLYTSYLASDQYGILDLSTIVINFVFPVATVSVSMGVLRFAIEDAEDSACYVTAGALICLLSCALVAILLPVLDLPIFGGLGDYKVWFLLCYVASTFQSYCGSVARALNHIRLISVSAVTSSIVMGSAAVILIAVYGWGLEGYFASFALGNTVAILLLIIGGEQWRSIKVGEVLENREKCSRLLGFSAPLAPNAVCWSVGTTFSRFLITGVLGVSASGLYAAASRIPNLLNALQQVFSQAWEVSSFQEYKQQGIEGFYTSVWSVYRLVMASASVVISILSPAIAAVLLQGSYYDVWHLVPILICAFYIDALNNFIGVVYQMELKTKELLVTTVLGAAVCVIATAVLLKGMGILAACLGVLLGNLVIFGARQFSVRRLLAVRWQTPETLISIALIFAQSIVLYCQPHGYMAIALMVGVGVIAFLVWNSRELIGRGLGLLRRERGAK